jgi:AraC-like DNA-binding protein
MFNFTMHPVHPYLQPFVSNYCIMDIESPETISNVFVAKTSSVLMFHIGMPSSLVSIQYDFPNTPKKHYTFYRHQAWLGGMLTEPLMGHMSHKGCYLCVIFTAFGVHHFMKESAIALTNHGCSIDCLGLPHSFDDLMDKLYNTNSKTNALQLVENELLSYYDELNIPFSVKNMSPVTDFIGRQNGIVKIKDLEDKFRISRRWLEKQFAAQVGVSPKEFARVTRFNALLNQIFTDPSVSLHLLMDDFGYYDQSHLNKDFNEFTGQTPLAYLTSTPNNLNNMFLKQLSDK